MKLHILVVLSALHIVAAGIVRADDSALTAARRGFVTHLLREKKVGLAVAELRTMAVENQNPLVSFRPIPGHTHFSTIQPLIREISRRILADTGKTVTMDFKTLSEFAVPSKDQSASP